MKGSTKLLIAIFITGLLWFIKHCWSIYPHLFEDRYVDSWEEGIIVIYFIIAFVLSVWNAFIQWDEDVNNQYYFEFLIDKLKDKDNYTIVLLLSPFTYLFVGISFIKKLSDKYLGENEDDI